MDKLTQMKHNNGDYYLNATPREKKPLVGTMRTLSGAARYQVLEMAREKELHSLRRVSLTFFDRRWSTVHNRDH
jgi:hypothetical protein